MSCAVGAQTPSSTCPRTTLVYLLGSRYCETDQLSEIAWKLLRHSADRLGARAGDLRLRAPAHRVRLPARARDATAWEAYNEGSGVCRDYAHLAIAFCRCMNIPARYCTGYLGDIGIPPPYGPMDFAAGSRRISATAGTPSTRATTRRASAAC